MSTGAAGKGDGNGDRKLSAGQPAPSIAWQRGRLHSAPGHQAKPGEVPMSSRLNASRLDRELACRGWTANDLAAAARISPATISAARRGRPVNHRTLRKIADALIKVPIVSGVEALLDPVATGSPQ
jgi:DNA-binding Xre family transcriptional regulator